MTIEYAKPPCNPRRSYKQIVVAVLAAKGEWVRIGLDDVGGSGHSMKRTLIYQAGYSRGLSFQTTIVDGFIYVKLRDEEPATPASGSDAASPVRCNSHHATYRMLG